MTTRCKPGGADDDLRSAGPRLALPEQEVDRPVRYRRETAGGTAVRIHCSIPVWRLACEGRIPVINRIILEKGVVAGGELGARDVIRFENAGEGPIPLIPRGPGAKPGVSAAGYILSPGFPIQCAAGLTGNVCAAYNRVARAETLSPGL
jgi:hypothetical protein